MINWTRTLNNGFILELGIDYSIIFTGNEYTIEQLDSFISHIKLNNSSEITASFRNIKYNNKCIIIDYPNNNLFNYSYKLNKVDKKTLIQFLLDLRSVSNFNRLTKMVEES
jgi:hypothetical protein